MKLKTPKFPRKGHHAAAPAAGVTYAPPVTPGQPAPQTGLTRTATPEPVSPLKKATSGLAAPTRQRNAAVMIAGAVFVIFAAALAASVASSFDDSLEVLVAAGPIAEGQRVTEANFRTVKIAAGEGDIQAVSPLSLPDLVDRVAAGPIGDGSMIHPDQFSIATDETKVVIGALLGPDQYPASGLKPGDRVRLIETGDVYAGDDDTFSSGREIAIGDITEVVELDRSGSLHFAIRVGESASNVVAERIAQDRLTIALVDGSRIVEPVVGLEAANPADRLEAQITDEDGEGE